MTWIPMRPRFGGGHVPKELRGVVIGTCKCGQRCRVKLMISASLLQTLGWEQTQLVGIRSGALADRGLLAITSALADDDHPRRLQRLKSRRDTVRGVYLEVDAVVFGIPNVEVGKRQHVVEDRVRVVDGTTLIIPLPKWAQVPEESGS